MKRTISFIAIILAIAVVWLSILAMIRSERVEPIATDAVTSERYSSDSLEISFAFPSEYDLTETDLSTGNRERYSLVLIEDGHVPPEAGEGPTAITIDVFQNNLDGYTAQSFATTTADSNWKLGPGVFEPRTIGSEVGVEYSWSGLYEGWSVVVARPDYVYMFSVTYISPEDRILSDFESVLETVRFAD